jgi:hypothetical protein
MAESRSAHALCLTRGEVILTAVLFVVGVGVSDLHELLFGQGTDRLFSITIDATQGALFWSAVLIGIRRFFAFVFRRLRREPAGNPS